MINIEYANQAGDAMNVAGSLRSFSLQPINQEKRTTFTALGNCTGHALSGDVQRSHISECFNALVKVLFVSFFENSNAGVFRSKVDK